MTESTNSVSEKIALLIPAHNEALVIADTIWGAVQAGMDKQDIYVVNDSSTDDTYWIAVGILGERNVMSVNRGGKALALQAGLQHFMLTTWYDWIQIVDADSVFSADYFHKIRQHCRPGVAAVCGQVKSLQNNWITSYRAMEYTVFQDFYKTIQNKFNMIGVMPGPATCFNAIVFDKLDFSSDTLTEDFDMTLQIHRKKHGRIIYEPGAQSWTQDPPTLPIYVKQIDRWYTGFFQVMKKFKVGSQRSAVDIMLLLQTLDGVFYIVQLALLAGLSILSYGHVDLKAIFAADFIVLLLLASYAAFRMKRIDLITPVPMYYLLRIICIGMFAWAGIKVFLLSKAKTGGLWNTAHISHHPEALDFALKGGDVT